jgi:hypothetical protein
VTVGGESWLPAPRTGRPGFGVVLAARALGEFGNDSKRFTDARARKNYSAGPPPSSGLRVLTNVAGGSDGTPRSRTEIDAHPRLTAVRSDQHAGSIKLPAIGEPMMSRTPTNGDSRRARSPRLPPQQREASRCAEVTDTAESPAMESINRESATPSAPSASEAQPTSASDAPGDDRSLIRYAGSTLELKASRPRRARRASRSRSC